MAGFAITANAATIGVNTGPADQGIGTTDTAGVVAQNNWNDKLAGNFGATAVTNDSGTLLATTVSVNTQWTNTSGSGNSDANHTLMNGGMDNGGGVQGFTVASVPYPLYDVYIYFDGGSDEGRGGAFQVWDSDNGDAVLATQNAYDTFVFSGTYVSGNGLGPAGDGLDINGDAIGSNYVRFTGLSAPNIKIRSVADLLGNPATPRAPVNGFQIVEAIPEPSTALLAVFGIFGFLTRRKR